MDSKSNFKYKLFLLISLRKSVDTWRKITLGTILEFFNTPQYNYNTNYNKNNRKSINTTGSHNACLLIVSMAGFKWHTLIWHPSI